MVHRQLFLNGATLARREAYRRVLPLHEEYRTGQDYSLALRLARTTRLVRVDALCIYLPEFVAGRLSARQAQTFQDAVRICLDQFPCWTPRYRAVSVRRHAYRALLYVRRHHARSACLAALR